MKVMIHQRALRSARGLITASVNFQPLEVFKQTNLPIGWLCNLSSNLGHLRVKGGALLEINLG